MSDVAAEPVLNLTRKPPRFSLAHGFIVSILLHSIAASPLALRLLTPEPVEPEPLVLDLEGAQSDSQTEQKRIQEVQGAPAPPAPPAPPPPQEPPPQDVAKEPPKPEDAPVLPPEQKTEPAPPVAPPAPTSTDPETVKGADEQQEAQRIVQQRLDEAEVLKAYVKVLTKKVQDSLVYPAEGRRAGLHGVATVSFALLPSGAIRPDSLKIVESSGQPRLDASALKTVQSSAPFAPPPKEMTVAIAVVYERKR